MSTKPKPLFLVKTGSIARKDIQRIERLCGICVVEISHLDNGQFVTQPPIGDTSMQARAAMEAMLLVAGHPNASIAVSTITDFYTKLSIEGSPKAEVPDAS